MIFPKITRALFPQPNPPRFSSSPFSPSARLPFATSPPLSLHPPPCLLVATSVPSARLTASRWPPLRIPVDASAPPGGRLPDSPLSAIGVSFDISDSKGPVIQSPMLSED
ncbi:hypothetical protein GUJ93_ZPchr0006g40883 [Zizania palustris]|uniref:Uncharacterized protein n=1 Tax=Zizania palustris TaxID=103762 RepID=A0A8J5W3X0_ZIZPA|nr:hypothetical protein GUJ93_ZPchr0006g40883 [Zizania palustris]